MFFANAAITSHDGALEIGQRYFDAWCSSMAVSVTSRATERKTEFPTSTITRYRLDRAQWMLEILRMLRKRSKMVREAANRDHGLLAASLNPPR